MLTNTDPVHFVSEVNQGFYIRKCDNKGFKVTFNAALGTMDGTNFQGSTRLTGKPELVTCPQCKG
jgi:hypothetical protein